MNLAELFFFNYHIGLYMYFTVLYRHIKPIYFASEFPYLKEFTKAGYNLVYKFFQKGSFPPKSMLL